MNFITKLTISADLDTMRSDLETTLEKCPWPLEDIHLKTPGNQIGLRCRPTSADPYLDASGGLYDKTKHKFIAKESDFSEFNDLVNPYTKSKLTELAEIEKINLGRVRYMRLMPKTGLSIHHDWEVRYHYVLHTNEHSLFGEYNNNSDTKALCYHIPADSYFYKVDTTRDHFVYNGGWEPRIHLVVCAA